MAIDVASYRRVAERWSTKEEDINPSAAAVLMLQMCGEIERLQKADYEFQEKLADGITDAFLERRWIPVSERMPEVHTTVLAVTRAFPKNIRLAQMASHDGVMWRFCDMDDDDVDSFGITHWMPLPEPPLPEPPLPSPPVSRPPETRASLRGE